MAVPLSPRSRLDDEHGMPALRLAWFAPLPPVRSGIAAYNAELLPLLARRYEIDAFVEHLGWRADDRSWTRPDSDPARSGPAGPGLRILNAHDFVWRHVKRPYDLIVYQMGNEACHDYMWPYLVRYPGLVVLHDGQLHHARARCLLQRRRYDDYRAELHFNHPDATPGVAEVGAMGLLGRLQYFWPMLRVPVVVARGVAVHSAWLARDLREQFPDALIEVVRMGVTDPLATPACGRQRSMGAPDALDVSPPAAVTARPPSVRARHGISGDAVLFAAFGRITPEKRLGPALGALARAAAAGLTPHLLLVGEPVEYYDVMVEAARWGMRDCVTVTGFVADEELPAYLAAADVCVCLRWPSARETSASWLRAVATGKPTIIVDLAHTVDIPALDPRDSTIRHVRPSDSARASTDEMEPVCVAVDIVDEDHSLALAVDRLAGDAALRARLGGAARAFYERHHTLGHMADDYCRVIELTCAAAAADRPATRQARESLPPHLQADGTAHTRALVEEVGAAVDFLEE